MGILWKDQLNNTLFDVWLHKQIKRTHLWLNQKAKKGGINRKLSAINSRSLDTKKGFNELRSGDNRDTCEYSWLFESKLNNFPMS